MAKYKMKSLSVNLGGRVVRKSDTPTIDGDKFPEVEIVAAEKAGFIEKVKGSDKPKDDKSENDKSEKPKPKASGSGAKSTNNKTK
jgi:hypothetical protein